jgi:hypothetical protein
MVRRTAAKPSGSPGGLAQRAATEGEGEGVEGRGAGRREADRGELGGAAAGELVGGREAVGETGETGETGSETGETGSELGEDRE